MKAKSFIFLFIILLPSLSYAVKVYKIVDEDGNVTFSQVPPGSNFQPESSSVEEVKVSTGGMSTVRVEFDEEYCGEIRLPKQAEGYRSSAKYYAKNMMKSQQRWQRELERISAKIQRENNRQINASLHNRNSTYQQQRNLQYQQQGLRDGERLRDLRCAVNWAEKKQGVIEEDQKEASEEKARLLVISSNLEGRLHSKCGQEPAFDPSDKTNEASRKAWYKCSKEIMRDLRKVRARMRQM